VHVPVPGSWQLTTLPSQQVVWALQDFDVTGRVAAKSTSVCGVAPGAGFSAATCSWLRRVAQEADLAAEPRIAARDSALRGAGLFISAKPAAEMKSRVQTTIADFFMSSPPGTHSVDSLLGIPSTKKVHASLRSEPQSERSAPREKCREKCQPIRKQLIRLN
jgi:hypothetical protein